MQVDIVLPDHQYMYSCLKVKNLEQGTMFPGGTVFILILSDMMCHEITCKMFFSQLQPSLQVQHRN